MFGEMLDNVRIRKPLIHCITNHVTANDCANILLACGASPIMGDDMNEAEEITALCSGLSISLGTLNRSIIPSMLSSGKKANELLKPIVFDPVGVGASKLRADTARQIMNGVKLSVIRGNISEIKFLASGFWGISGVDADISDTVTNSNLDTSVDFIKNFSEKTGAVIAVTGEIDIVADSEKAFVIYNGHPMMSRVTGTGCQLSALTAALAGANPDNILQAAAASVCAMGLCGEKAFERLTLLDGNASYRSYIIDAVYNLSAKELERGAKYEIR